MKKIIWIYSINVQEIAPFGYGPTMPVKQSKMFQQKIKMVLPPEIDLEFISYDASSNEIPAADLIVFNDLDSRYISDEIKEKAVVIPFQDVASNNTEKIEKILINALKQDQID